MKGCEVNFDGIVGPTHNYSGLAYGNIASLKNQQSFSNPRKAALQGLAKMKYLMDLGVKQAVLPPQERPDIRTLRLLGFHGSNQDVITQAFKESPTLFFACCSASSMWAANAATVSPSCDTRDHRVHITPANLTSKFHRSIESPITSAVLKAIFFDESHFVVHPPLPSAQAFADEGAANHTRFCKEFCLPGVQLFVFGRSAFQNDAVQMQYPARQTLEASYANIRNHRLNPKFVVIAKQSSLAINAGVFHNDVISVGHQNLFLYHELAFEESDHVIKKLQEKLISVCNIELIPIKIAQAQIPIEDAVASYLFNSQIITTSDGAMHLIAPLECQEISSVKNFLSNLVGRFFKQVHYLDVRESMRNGGGPACLRLRIVLTDQEVAAANPHVFLTKDLYAQLTRWVEKHYRDRLTPQDLTDPSLLIEGKTALDELFQILHLKDFEQVVR